MKQKLVIFDLQSLKDLLIHFTSGAIPPDSEAVGFSVSKILERYICLEVSSSQWDPEDEVTPSGDLVPLIVRYEGGRVLKIERPQDAGPGSWSAPGDVEAPKRNG